MLACCAVGMLGAFIAGASARAATEQQIRDAFDTVFIHYDKREDGVRVIQSECVIPRQLPSVWAVLTDYDDLETFIPILRESRVESSDERGHILYQRGEIRILFFRRRFQITAQVIEAPHREITYDSVDGDFHVYRGWWRLYAQPEGTLVRHYLEVKPKFAMPKIIIKRMERGVVKSIIRQSMETSSAASG